MYLFRAPNCTYYTRICLPKKLRDRGFPFDLKISLFSKYRSEALFRNATMTVAIKKLLDFVSDDTTVDDFKEEVNRENNDVRLSFVHFEYGAIPTRKVAVVKETKQSTIVNNAKSLNDALEEFIHSKSKEDIRPLTVKQLNQRIAHFIRSTSNVYTNEIKSACALRYRDLLLEEGRSVKSNKEYLAAVSQFFKWSCLMDYAATNPFTNIKLNQKKASGSNSSRQRWQKCELEKLFSSNNYKDKDDDFKFVTLLMLYHGLRPAEACQLRVKDVINKDGHTCLNITDEGTKQRVKTPASNRIIPLYPMLITVGFKAFIDIRKQKNSKQIFKYLPTNLNEDWSR